MREVKGGLEGREGGYWLVDLCEMAVASPDKNRGERETSARFKWREFVRFCRDGDVDSSVFSSVISKWTALQVSEPLLV